MAWGKPQDRQFRFPVALCYGEEAGPVKADYEVINVSESVLDTRISADSEDFQKNTRRMVDLLTEIKNEEELVREG